jgi:cobalt-zinc-cadmium efflux system protein
LYGREIAEDLTASIAAVEEVHHVHVWSITQERPMMTLHVRVSETMRPESVAADVKKRLAERFGVAHATVEVEFDGCADEESPAEAASSSG